MATQIIKKSQQAAGAFNGGEILENKPIGFPREGGHQKAFSNLFYWAHAWSDHGSTIGLHPHQGFEIMSFVLEGSIEHYDTGDQKWKKLEKGAAQIIRSGSGISHSEKLNAGAHMFQIWFDPNLSKTIQQPASYDDYADGAFPRYRNEGIETKVFKGEGSPLQMDSPGVEIYHHKLADQAHQLRLDEGKEHSFYLINGSIEIEGEQIEKDDFFRVSEQNQLSFKSQQQAELFQLSTPKALSYLTYADQMR